MTMRDSGFAHALPFGAELRPDGSVRFRLWAPDEPSVALVLDVPERVLPMAPAGDGFFELTTPAGAGQRYRYQLADGSRVPDPASRWQPDGVHGPSCVVDPCAYRWRTPGWRGRPWHEVVLYELHVGAFAGSYDGLRRRLDHLAGLGVTAIELMPLADFAGQRNWGYDQVCWYAPASAYGAPDQLKALIDACHEHELMVFLDVVYNHLGPDGAYLHRCAPAFFNAELATPWGPAIDYRRRPVRDFALHNVLYWLAEYRFDGLRFDAVDQIRDPGVPTILEEIGTTVRATIGSERHIHLVLENDANQARLLARDAALRPQLYDGQWNDDIHHVAHHLLTGETAGYYADYAERPQARLAAALATGYVYQGDRSAYRRGAVRGEPSAHLPPTAFVNCLQNHDQIGNRAFGERLTTLARPEALRALQAMLLLAPQIPLLFMGEEWAARTPFCFFTDFHDELADAVREGRRREFARFPAFADPEARARIPDPNAVATFARSCLGWTDMEQPEPAAWLAFVTGLLERRRVAIWPLLPAIGGHAGSSAVLAETAIEVAWQVTDGPPLRVIANLGDQATAIAPVATGEVLFALLPGAVADLARGRLAAWSVLWLRGAAA
jgi:maltooligosyltrehalose trehalohydrolase